MKITSIANKKIKLLKKLNQKKYRDQLNLFKIENAKIIVDAFEAGYCFENIFVTDELAKKIDKKILSPEKTIIITDKVSQYFSDLKTASGVCAVYKKIKPIKIDYCRPIVYLNAINDPGNLGAILRSALAFGFEQIIMDDKCADLFNQKTITSAKESIFKIKFSLDYQHKLLAKIKKSMLILATDLQADKTISQLKIKSPYCLVFGSESQGIDPKIKKIADHTFKIKISKQIESLNVAASAAIIFHRFKNLQ